tara:strand:+ start:51 stop:290 length:240 start_codon:yes stop_codon:yes gene_type:complete
MSERDIKNIIFEKNFPRNQTMKTFDVETTVTYTQWIRVSAEDKFAAQKRVNDMAWDITAIQYQTMTKAEATGTVRDCPE